MYAMQEKLHGDRYSRIDRPRTENKGEKKGGKRKRERRVRNVAVCRKRVSNESNIDRLYCRRIDTSNDTEMNNFVVACARSCACMRDPKFRSR